MAKRKTICKSGTCRKYGMKRRVSGGRKKGMPKNLKKAFKFAGKKLKAYDKKHGLSREAGDKLARELLGSL